MSATLLGVDTRVVYTVLIAAIAFQRLCELAMSRRNVRTLKARGALELGSEHYPWMVVLHASFLVSCVAEVWLFDRPWEPRVAVAALTALAAALGLRWWTLHTLGERWTTRVVIVPGEALVVGGPYRWLRHPNYLVVVTEIAAIPLVHCAWLTALVFGVANLVLLRKRIRVEEAALDELTAKGVG